MELKHPQGWFAAGREVGRAIELLSDGAFKLYVYVCLHAERQTGCLDLVESNMTRALGKSPALLKGYLEEMEGQGICRRRHGDPYRSFGQIEVCDDFWPYEKDPAHVQNEHETEYLERIRQRLSTHPCMRTAFTPADRRLALELCRKNVSLDCVERAILLGCSRKCTALLNGQIGGPITSLRYFQEIIEEVRQLQITADYWRYLELNLSRMEAELREKQAQVETK
jgi:hypothetical protein